MQDVSHQITKCSYKFILLIFFFLILFSEQEAWRPSDIAIDNQAAHDQPTVFGAKNKLQQEILTPLQDEVHILKEFIIVFNYWFILFIFYFRSLSWSNAFRCLATKSPKMPKKSARMLDFNNNLSLHLTSNFSTSCCVLGKIAKKLFN